MKSKLKSRVITGLKFLLPAAIIGFLIWKIEPSQWHQLSSQPKNYGLLAAALVIALMAMALSFARWCVLVRCQGIALSMLEAFRLGSICYLLSFVSAGSVGGDLFKAVFLARRRPGKRVAAIASVLVDRGSGLFGLLLLVAVGLFLSGDSTTVSPPVIGESPLIAGKAEGPGQPESLDMEQIKWATVGLIGLGTTVLALLILGGKSVDRLIEWGSGLPVLGGLIQTIGPPLRMFHHHPIAFGVSILMSIGVQGMLVLSIYMIARGLYPSPPTLTEHFIIVPIGMLASALPITPAGIGVLEWVIDQLYKVVPAVPTEASGVLVALVFELVKILMAVIGTVFYWSANEEVRESIEEAETEGGEAT